MFLVLEVTEGVLMTHTLILSIFVIVQSHTYAMTEPRTKEN